MLKPCTYTGAMMMVVALEPESTGAAEFGGYPPEPSLVMLPLTASKFMCCEPEASAICNLPHSRKSNSTRALTCLRAKAVGAYLEPPRTGTISVADERLKFSIQPRSIQGAGAESSANMACAAGP